MSRQIIGLCAAAALLAGSHAAHALMVVPTTASDPADGDESVTYATETLTAERTVDETTYYDIAQEIIVSGMAGVGASAGDTFTVMFELEGMVFAEDLSEDATMDDRLSLVPVGSSDPDDGAFSRVSGGMEGETSVTYRFGGANALDKADRLALRAKYAISAEGSGTITRTVRNVTLAGLNVNSTMVETAPEIIQLAPALELVSTANDLTATAASGFKTFEGGSSVDYLGSYFLSADVGRSANSADGRGTGTGGSLALDDILDVSSSTVTFDGDFSFASRVFADVDRDCENTTDNLLMRDDEGMVTGLMPVGVTEVDVEVYLCIEVDSTDEALRIPNTDPYTAVPDFTGLADAVIGPMPEVGILGAITRDGTTVHLPYLTTNEKFRQRLRVVNRGVAPVAYEMAFHGEDDMAGVEATGTFERGITVLNLGDGNLVEPGNGNSTSATLMVETDASTIDVATVQINRELGTTDTVVYESE